MPVDTLKVFYPGGNLQSLSFFKNGKLEGEVIQYYETGQVKEMMSYKNGKAHGKNIRYDKNGQLQLEATYKDGVLTMSKRYDDH